MDVVADLYYWTDHILAAAEFALWVWAVVDCLLRRPAAFQAAEKLTKPAWLAILVIAALFGYLFTQPFTSAAPIGPAALIATVAAAVYIVDVRPAVREISRRR